MQQSRITIESVFQYCFWKNQKNDFGFLKDDSKTFSYQLANGYTDDKTFSIIEKYPIIRINKSHSIAQKKIKVNAKNWFEKFILFIDSLSKKKDENVDIFGELTKINNLINDGYIVGEQPKLIALTENSAAYRKLIELFDKYNLRKNNIELDDTELDIWLHNHSSQELEDILKLFKNSPKNESSNYRE